MSAYRFGVTVNTDDHTLTIIQRDGADTLTLRVDEVEQLVSDLRTGAWLAGTPSGGHMPGGDRVPD